jgi:hypothetical protein
MIRYEPRITKLDEAKLAENARADRFQESSEASKRRFDSDGQLRREEETANNNSLI